METEQTLTIHEAKAIGFKIVEIRQTVKYLNRQMRELELFLHGKFQLEED